MQSPEMSNAIAVIKLDPLAEMHLLLREHGWEPEYEPDGAGDAWTWRLGALVIVTFVSTIYRLHRGKKLTRRESVWAEKGGRKGGSTSVAVLRRRLKQLVK
jgi:hypothetical protein